VTEQPLVSVVIPTRDRPDALRSCLESLAALEYPRSRLQVIVVDDGSREPTTVDGGDVAVVRTPGLGPAGARNAGVERARGEALAFVDDDCRPRPDWLTRMVGRWRQAPEHAVGGLTVNALGASLCVEAAQLVIDVGYEQNAAADRRWFTTNNLLVPADGFRKLGGFDANYSTAEDRDFCARWLASGRRMTYEPDAVVEHARTMDLAGFAAMHFRYGRGAFRFHRDRRREGSPVAVEPSYYAALAREAFVRGASLGRAAALEGLLLVWHVANTAGFLYEWGQSRLNRQRPTAIL
jgi:glycosyltransferase involved in cell wall biosynthesis